VWQCAVSVLATNSHNILSNNLNWNWFNKCFIYNIEISFVRSVVAPSSEIKLDWSVLTNVRIYHRRLGFPSFANVDICDNSFSENKTKPVQNIILVFWSVWPSLFERKKL